MEIDGDVYLIYFLLLMRSQTHSHTKKQTQQIQSPLTRLSTWTSLAHYVMIDRDYTNLSGKFSQFLFRSSSIICNATFSSSSIILSSTSPPSCPPAISSVSKAQEVLLLISDWGACKRLFWSSSTIISQFESDRGPAPFCQTPMREFSVSSLRQVREGDGDLQHLRSLALRIAESVVEEVEELLLLLPELLLRSLAAAISFVTTGKFVLAFLPLIKIAASSYALAASSAVSYVPSHTLLFLH